MNRFGIVTSAVFRLHKQPAQVHVGYPLKPQPLNYLRTYLTKPTKKPQGGMILYPSTSFNAILNLTSTFSHTNTDKRTQIITTAGGSPLGNTALLLFFHDAASKPASLSPFEAVPHLVNTVKTQSFLNFVKGIPAEVAQVTNPRGAFATLSTSEITLGFVGAVGMECEVCYCIVSYVISYPTPPKKPCTRTLWTFFLSFLSLSFLLHVFFYFLILK